MNIIEFHQAVEHVWDKIEATLEAQDCDVDCETQGAVFTMTFEDGSQIVINKQEAMLELWLASRLGGFHFAFRDGDWVSSEGTSFWDHLEQAIDYYGETVHFER